MSSKAKTQNLKNENLVENKSLSLVTSPISLNTKQEEQYKINKSI